MAQRKKEKESLIVKIKLRQGFANGPFLSGFVFSFFTFFLPRISPNSPPFFFFFLRNMKTFTLKIFPKSFLSLKVHGRIGLLLEDKWYTAFVPEAWQPKACVLSKDGILGALLTCACCTIQILSCNGVTSHPQ